MDIRQHVETHTPLMLQLVSEGVVAIPLADLDQLVQMAHESVHPRGHLSGPEEEEEKDNPQIETGYDKMQLRLTAAHLAASIESTRIQASSGLDTEGSQFTPLAEKIYAFLTQ